MNASTEHRADGRSFVIGILGAESTGKTVLAAELAAALRSRAGTQVTLVDEYLREFCAVHARTPQQDEQQAIANEQTRRVEAAAASVLHGIVVADTTALMIAVYSDIVFGDASLYAGAQAAHRRCDLTLLTALDLPWQEDGLQRDGPHVREPVDTLVRAALTRAGVAYAVIAGTGTARLEAALAAVLAALRAAPGAWLPSAVGTTGLDSSATADGSPESTADAGASTRWSSVCERCGDPDCDRQLLRLPH